MLGRAALPVLLITLGIQLAETKLRVGGCDLVATLTRLLIAPSLAWLAGSILGLKDLELAVVVIFSALPPAVMVLVFSHEYGGESERNAQVIAGHFALSFYSVGFAGDFWGSVVRGGESSGTIGWPSSSWRSTWPSKTTTSR